MVFGYKAKQAGIREIDRVISTYPVVILGEIAMLYRLPVNVQSIVLYFSLFILMQYKCVA